MHGCCVYYMHENHARLDYANFAWGKYLFRKPFQSRDNDDGIWHYDNHMYDSNVFDKVRRIFSIQCSSNWNDLCCFFAISFFTPSTFDKHKKPQWNSFGPNGNVNISGTKKNKLPSTIDYSNVKNHCTNSKIDRIFSKYWMASNSGNVIYIRVHDQIHVMGSFTMCRFVEIRVTIYTKSIA